MNPILIPFFCVLTTLAFVGAEGAVGGTGTVGVAGVAGVVGVGGVCGVADRTVGVVGVVGVCGDCSVSFEMTGFSLEMTGFSLEMTGAEATGEGFCGCGGVTGFGVWVFVIGVVGDVTWTICLTTGVSGCTTPLAMSS